MLHVEPRLVCGPHQKAAFAHIGGACGAAQRSRFGIQLDPVGDIRSALNGLQGVGELLVGINQEIRVAERPGWNAVGEAFTLAEFRRLEGHRPQNRAVIHVLHGEAQGLKRCASPAIGGLNRDAEFTHLSVARTACNRAAGGIKQHPAGCLHKAVGQIRIVLIGEQGADVFGQRDVLLDAQLQIFWSDLNSDWGVIDFPDGDSKMLHLSLIATASGQREGMAAHMGLIGRSLENPDGWTSVVEYQQIITVKTYAASRGREGWSEMQVNGFVLACTLKGKSREKGLPTLAFAQPESKTLLGAREGSSSKTLKGGTAFV